MMRSFGPKRAHEEDENSLQQPSKKIKVSLSLGQNEAFSNQTVTNLEPHGVYGFGGNIVGDSFGGDLYAHHQNTNTATVSSIPIAPTFVLRPPAQKERKVIFIDLGDEHTEEPEPALPPVKPTETINNSADFSLKSQRQTEVPLYSGDEGSYPVTTDDPDMSVGDVMQAFESEDQGTNSKAGNIILDEDEAVAVVEQQKPSEAATGDLILSQPGQEVAKVPESVNVRLRDYQRDGVRFLYNAYMQGKGAILGDDMGLGKTIQTIAFIIAIFGSKKFSLSSGSESTNQKNQMTILVIAPVSVIENWEREIAQWGKLAQRPLTVCRFLGAQRKKSLDSVKSKRFEIVITSYGTLREDIDELCSVDWQCVIFDEMHKLKTRKAKVTLCSNQFKTKRRYGLTGTVMQNNFEELWTLLDFVQPGALGTLKEFNEKFIRHIKQGQKRGASMNDIGKAKIATRKLNKAIKKIVLRRDKSVIADLLPGKDDHIVFCTLTPLQLEMYKRILESNLYKTLVQQQEMCTCGSKLRYGNCCSPLKDKEKADWKKMLLPSITNLIKIAQHPALVIPTEKKKDQDLESYERMKQFRNLAFGEDRQKIVELINQGQDEILCGKMRTLVELLKIWYQKGNKVLLFSSSTRILDILEAMLARHSYSYGRLDGSTEVNARQQIIDTFNTSTHKDRFVFLLSTRAGGLGLNITSANVVVVYDASWNVTQDLQAQDRAYRIGQVKHTDVYRLISAGTIEEMIYQRQVYKQQMASISLSGKHVHRYFDGVLGVKGQEGEIFGLLNLLKLTTETVLSRDLIDRVKKEEQIFTMERSKVPKNTNTPSPMTQVFAGPPDRIPAEHEIIDLETLKSDINSKSASSNVPRRYFDNDIAAALSSTGVIYAHNNNEVVDEAEVERQRSREAEQRIWYEEDMASQGQQQPISRALSQISNSRRLGYMPLVLQPVYTTTPTSASPVHTIPLSTRPIPQYHHIPYRNHKSLPTDSFNTPLTYNQNSSTTTTSSIPLASTESANLQQQLNSVDLQLLQLQQEAEAQSQQALLSQRARMLQQTQKNYPHQAHPYQVANGTEPNGNDPGAGAGAGAGGTTQVRTQQNDKHIPPVFITLDD